MIVFRILNSEIVYDGDVIEVKENIPNSEVYMKIYGGMIGKLSLETPHYKISGRNIHLPSKEINLADVKSFVYSAVSKIIREDKKPSISISSEGIVYDFSIESHEVKITEKVLNGVHILSTALQKPLLGSTMNVQLPPWVAPFTLLSASISLDEKPRDVIRKHFQQITKITTVHGYIEKGGSKLVRFYSEEPGRRVLCYTQVMGYLCFEDTGKIQEVRPTDKEVQGIINDILRDYVKCTVERGMVLV